MNDARPTPVARAPALPTPPLEVPTETFPPDTPRPTLHALLPTLRPHRIGNYHLGHLLGEGGMGAVYLAEQQTPVARQVALKIVHTSLLTPGHLDRFHAERNALARLNHPNIAVLHEAGATEDGFPFFAMEHVPGGEALHTYCDQRRLGIEERLELFVQTCRGVQHAHQKGVLHRDLKPSNVLVTEVDGCRVAKVIDFGLAKSLDEIPLSDHTQLTGGALVGTPAYMSPEILEGDQDLDTRTDVYSLGVMLYELLVDTRPATLFTALRNAQPWPATGDQTPRPSRRALEASTDALTARRTTGPELKRRLAGDLDWIALRALAADRNDRYASVSELAADLERHLRFEPVSVRPPTLTYQVRKFSRRHRTAVLTSCGLLAMLILGGLAFWQTRRQDEHRAHLAAELNRDVERIEWLQRVAHQLPLDMRQDEDPAIRQMMQRIAATRDHNASALASYALGRGQLALDDPEAARHHLQAALTAGYDGPEARLALGWSLSRLYDRQLDIIRRYPDKDLRQAERQRANRELRQPALDLLHQSSAGNWIAPELLEATLALQQGELDLAIERGRMASQRIGWLYEARFVVGRALLRQAEEAWEMTRQLDPAEALYQEAVLEVKKGLHIGRSDPEGHRLLCNTLGRYVNFLVRFSRPGFDERLDQSLEACGAAALAAPLSLEPLIAQATAWHGKAEIELWDRGQDPRPSLMQVFTLLTDATSQFQDSSSLSNAAHEEVLRLLGRAAQTEGTYLYRIGESPIPAFQRAEDYLRQAVRLGPAAADSWSRLASVLAQRASWLELRGQDPTPDLSAAIQAARQAASLQPNMFAAHYSLGQALCSRADFNLSRGLPADVSLDEAEIAFSRAQTLEPSSLIASGALAQVHILRSKALRRRGDDTAKILGRGIQMLDTAIEEAPDGTYFLFQKAQSLLGLAWNALERGDNPTAHTGAARQTFLQGIKTIPRVAGTWMELAEAPLIEARWALANGHFDEIASAADEIERHARQGLELDEGRSDGHQMIALAHMVRAVAAPHNSEAISQAQQALQRAIELAPQTASHRVVAARLAWLATQGTPTETWSVAQRQSWNDGIEQAEEALRLDATNAEALLLQGALLAMDPTTHSAGETLITRARRDHARLVLDWRQPTTAPYS